MLSFVSDKINEVLMSSLEVLFSYTLPVDLEPYNVPQEKQHICHSSLSWNTLGSIGTDEKNHKLLHHFFFPFLTPELFGSAPRAPEKTGLNIKKAFVHQCKYEKV